MHSWIEIVQVAQEESSDIPDLAHSFACFLNGAEEYWLQLTAQRMQYRRGCEGLAWLLFGRPQHTSLSNVSDKYIQNIRVIKTAQTDVAPMVTSVL